MINKLLIWVLASLSCFFFLLSCPVQGSDKPSTPVKKSDLVKKAEPAGMLKNSDDFIIGPEDVLHINVWREDAMTKTVPVRLDVKISLPLMNDIQAEGLTPMQLKNQITKLLEGMIENPEVSVTVMEINSFRVYVNGEVKKPGVVRLRQKASFIQLISMVEGFTEWANQKKILLIRKENNVEKRIYLNYKKIVEGDEPDQMINRGDIIIVK
jgi:polysaccharide export outer membrane protein